MVDIVPAYTRFKWGFIGPFYSKVKMDDIGPVCTKVNLFFLFLSI